MRDILHELLEEAAPDSQPRAMAEAAQRLYVVSMSVCEKFGLPHTAINCAVWSSGKDSGSTKPKHGQGLIFDPQLGRWSLSPVLVPAGPVCAFGKAWLMVTSRPERLKHRKEPSQELYRVDVARWCHENPGYKYKPSFDVNWRYQRYDTSGSLWYQSEAGDSCDLCKDALPVGEDVLITVEQRLYCSPCSSNFTASLDLASQRAEKRRSRKTATALFEAAAGLVNILTAPNAADINKDIETMFGVKP